MNGQKDLLHGVPCVAILHSEPPEAAEHEVRVLLVDAFEGHARMALEGVPLLLEGRSDRGHHSKCATLTKTSYPA